MQLVIGHGEVGVAIQNILGAKMHDPFKGLNEEGEFTIIHICFPYSGEFISHVENYKKKFNASLVIVHSTVPVGTCAKLKAVHSPVRGVHPNLEKGIRTFIKYFGGERAEEAADLFKYCGIKTKVVEKSETTEAGKLWSTTQYGLYIAVNKWIHDWCEKNSVDFDIVYGDFTKTYNEGY